MVPFQETVNSKEELIELAKKGYEDFKNKKITKNDFCMFFGFTHGEAIIKYYSDNFEQLLIDGGFNPGSVAYFAGAINAWKNLRDGKYVFPPISTCHVSPVMEIDSKDTVSCCLNALATKPFVLLAGVSGTGKSRIVRKFAQASVTEELQRQYDPESVENGFSRFALHKPANFELVQVKPNWHNSLEVVGYKSNIGGAHYEYTPFVEFVARAWKHLDIPFFLCLDEMNLAPVEQYFAEFLSAIESRSIENEEYETDPIIKPFQKFGGNLCKEMLDHLAGENELLRYRFTHKGFTLPKNLFIIGTVNMDETTFSFSRKVLDRAMSIVMNDVNYEKFFNGQSDDDIQEITDDIKELLLNRAIKGLDARMNDAYIVKQYLESINSMLDETPFKLGYRAANEALLYVSASHQLQPSITTNEALDEFTMMKILSRIEGDKRSIGNLLIDLQNVITVEFPSSNKKLTEMQQTLESKQFVSYWT